MIRLVSPGERGGYMTVEMTPFDAISLVEGLTYAVLHLEHLQQSDDPESAQFLWGPKEKDARANISEIQRLMQHREQLLSAEEGRAVPQ